jgi:hypothetical protein
MCVGASAKQLRLRTLTAREADLQTGSGSRLPRPPISGHRHLKPISPH